MSAIDCLLLWAFIFDMILVRLSGRDWCVDGIAGTAGGGPEIDCGFMKFLMLCIRACVNLVNIGILDFFFTLFSALTVAVVGRLLVEDGSTSVRLEGGGGGGGVSGVATSMDLVWTTGNP